MKPKRSGKFWYKNEKETLERLGLRQVPGSGNGWVHKEDGENESILAQLKSTDSETFTIKIKDWHKLELHSNQSHKLPLFINQKVGGPILITLRPQDLIAIAKHLKGELVVNKEICFSDDFSSDEQNIKKTKKKKQQNSVKDLAKARELFHKSRENSFKNKKRWYRQVCNC